MDVDELRKFRLCSHIMLRSWFLC